MLYHLLFTETVLKQIRCLKAELTSSVLTCDLAITRFTQQETKTRRQYLEYGPLPQQALRQVLPGQLSGRLQLLVPISGLKTNQQKNTD